MQYIRLRHELIEAKYNESTGKWLLKIRKTTSGSTPEDERVEIIEEEADFVLTAVGVLSRWKWPDIEGLNDFGGQLMHSAA